MTGYDPSRPPWNFGPYESPAVTYRHRPDRRDLAMGCQAAAAALRWPPYRSACSSCGGGSHVLPGEPCILCQPIVFELQVLKRKYDRLRFASNEYLEAAGNLIDYVDESFGPGRLDEEYADMKTKVSLYDNQLAIILKE